MSSRSHEDLDDGLAAGQRLVAEVVGVAALGVGGDDAFGDLRQRFLQTDVGGHRMLMGLREDISPNDVASSCFMLGGWRSPVNLLLSILRPSVRQNTTISGDRRPRHDLAN